MKLIGSVAFAQIGAELAGYLAPALEKVVDLTGRFAHWLSGLDPAVLTVVGAIAGLVAILAPLLITFGKLFTGISAVIKVINLMGGAISLASAGPMLGIIAVIGLIIAACVALYKNWDTVKAKAIELGQTIKSTWESVKNAISTAANAIFDAMTWPYRKAWDIIIDIVRKIKSLFPIKIGNFFGHIELPHFSIKGSLSLKPPRVPRINVDWYDKGGIFDSPSVIGVGEKRPEFVGALDDLRKIVREESDSGNSSTVINVYASPNMDVNQLATKIEQILVKQQKQRSKAYGGI